MDRIPEGYENLETFEEGVPTLLHELSSYDQIKGLALYCQMLKAGILHADFHTGNWFLNKETGETLAIDFGLASELKDASKKHLKRAIQFIAAPVALIDEDLAEDLLFAFEGDEEEMREALLAAAELF